MAVRHELVGGGSGRPAATFLIKEWGQSCLNPRAAMSRCRIANVTIVRGDETEQHELADRSALRAHVAEHFGFDLHEIERMRVPSIPEWA